MVNWLVMEDPKQAPYYAVIFTSILKDENPEYDIMAKRMEELCSQMPGFLGIDHARTALGITICYWKDLSSIEHWKKNSEHLEAQQKGRESFYSWYQVQIAKVERAYSVGKKFPES